MLVESTCVFGGLTAMTAAYQGYYDAVYAKKKNFFLKNTALVNVDPSHKIFTECFNGAMLAGTTYYGIDTTIKASNLFTTIPALVALNVAPIFYWVGCLASSGRYHCIRDKFFEATTPAGREHAFKGSRKGLLPYYIPSQVDVQCYGNYPSDNSAKVSTLKDIVAHRRAIEYGFQTFSTAFTVTNNNEYKYESHRIDINESSYSKVITLDVEKLTMWNPVRYLLAKATFKKSYDYDDTPNAPNQKLIPDPLKDYLKSKIESGYVVKVSKGSSPPSFLEWKNDEHNSLIETLDLDEKYNENVKKEVPQIDKPKTYQLGNGVKVTLALDDKTHRVHFESMTWLENIKSVFGLGYDKVDAKKLNKTIESNIITITGSDSHVAEAIKDLAFEVKQEGTGNNKVVSIYDTSKDNPVFGENVEPLYNATLHKIKYTDRVKDEEEKLSDSYLSYAWAYMIDIGYLILTPLMKILDISNNVVLGALKIPINLVMGLVGIIWDGIFMLFSLVPALERYTDEMLLEDLANTMVKSNANNADGELSPEQNNLNVSKKTSKAYIVRNNKVKVSFSETRPVEKVESNTMPKPQPENIV